MKCSNRKSAAPLLMAFAIFAMIAGCHAAYMPPIDRGLIAQTVNEVAPRIDEYLRTLELNGFACFRQ